MERFAAIDFETANWCPSSVCAIGVVCVERGEVSGSYYSLIRPAPFYFSSKNMAVHGIRPEETEDAPTFPTVWREVAMLVGDMPLVAHNSPFDRKCLEAAHSCFGMPYPAYTFYCTCRLARKYFKELPNHKLPTVATHCGYDLSHHHHALSDAEACAAIMLRIIRDFGI